MQRLICLARQYKADILFLIGYSLLFYLVVRFLAFLLPIGLGVFWTIVSMPVYRLINSRLRWKPKVCVYIVTTISAIVCICVISLLSFLVTYEVLHFQEQIKYFQLDDLHPAVQSFITRSIPKFTELLKENILPSVASNIVRSAPDIFSYFLSVPAGILLPILSIMLSSLFLIQRKNIKYFSIRMIGHRAYRIIRSVLRSRASHPHGFILSYFTVYTITFSESLTALLLLKMKFPVITALAVTISDIFPVIGPGVILLPLSIYRLLCGNFIQCIGLFVSWLLITIIRQIVEPRLISKIIKIPTSIMFLSIYISMISGSFWYIPYTALLFTLYSVFSEVISQYKKSVE